MLHTCIAANKPNRREREARKMLLKEAHDTAAVRRVRGKRVTSRHVPIRNVAVVVNKGFMFTLISRPLPPSVLHTSTTANGPDHAAPQAV